MSRRRRSSFIDEALKSALGVGKTVRHERGLFGTKKTVVTYHDSGKTKTFTPEAGVFGSRIRTKTYRHGVATKEGYLDGNVEHTTRRYQTRSTARTIGSVSVGSDICFKCEGLGRLSFECGTCAGTGRFSFKGKCRACNGASYVGDGQCVRCSGTGIYSSPKTDICRQCDGSGFRNVECKRCQGTGSYNPAPPDPRSEHQVDSTPPFRIAPAPTSFEPDFGDFRPSAAYLVFLVVGTAATFWLGQHFFSGHRTINSILACLAFLGIFAHGKQSISAFFWTIGRNLLVSFTGLAIAAVMIWLLWNFIF